MARQKPDAKDIVTEFGQWLTSMLAAISFGVTLFICVADEQDFLLAVFKAMLAFVVVRVAGVAAFGLIAALDVKTQEHARTSQSEGKDY